MELGRRPRACAGACPKCVVYPIWHLKKVTRLRSVRCEQRVRLRAVYLSLNSHDCSRIGSGSGHVPSADSIARVICGARAP